MRILGQRKWQTTCRQPQRERRDHGERPALTATTNKVEECQFSMWSQVYFSNLHFKKKYKHLCMLCLDITQRFLFQRGSDQPQQFCFFFFPPKSSGLKVCFLSGRLKLPKTLGESKAWSESPQQYCTLCAAAPSPSSRCNS